MSRIQPPKRPGPITRLLLRVARRQSGGKLPEPFAVQAHHPRLLKGYGGFELAFMHSRRAPRRLKELAELKAAALCGCEWCMDYGSWLSSHPGGVTEEQMLVLEYAECISRTPVDVPDELFEALRRRFDEAQLIELTYAAAIETCGPVSTGRSGS